MSHAPNSTAALGPSRYQEHLEQYRNEGRIAAQPKPGFLGEPSNPYMTGTDAAMAWMEGLIEIYDANGWKPN